MVSAETKTERLMALEQLLLSRHWGMARREIAERLGIHRSTAYRYVDELSKHIPLYEDDEGLVHLDRDNYVSGLKLTIHEIMALYLSVSLMTSQSDRKNPHAAAALRKLGGALSGLSPRLSSHILANADILDGFSLIDDRHYLGILQTITRSWAYAKKAVITHHSARRNEDDRYVFSTYIILPYAAGRTLHAIGRCDHEDHVRTLRLDRIKDAQMTDEPYEIPENFDIQRHLSGSWGIWASESPPVEVTIRFSRRVSDRVKETVWHKSQRLEETEEGLIWRAEIDEPREMLPWIRGWGADAEVLSPADLREAIAEESRRLSALYG